MLKMLRSKDHKITRSKVFLLMILSLMILSLTTGCGEEKIIGTPDKAILAYAEIAMTGESENLSAAGFSEEDKNSIRQAVANNFIASLSDIAPLSDASAQELAQIYFDRLKGNVTFKTTLKSEGAQPIVELATTPIDYAASAKSAGKNDELIALLGMIGKLKSEGVTEEQLKASPDVQRLAVSAFSKYIAGISFQPEKTFEIPCQKADGTDGNAHWMPVDGKNLIDLLTGQK